MYCLPPFEFRLGLELYVAMNAAGEPVVGYTCSDPAVFTIKRGVYVVVGDSRILYVGKFEQTFAKRWVYKKRGAYTTTKKPSCSRRSRSA